MSISALSTEYDLTRTGAIELDALDPLAAYRAAFRFPRTPEGEPYLYFTGNSLGLQPVKTLATVEQELEDWAALGVEGHFEARAPWYSYQEQVQGMLADVVGALPHEVAAMNTLTTNLHLLMVSFYRPQPGRYRILVEPRAFPSDQYAVASQVRWHGYDPSDAIIELQPREGEDTIRTEDIEALLAERGGEIALVMLGGVNFYTGQAFEMERITRAAHEAGCTVGFDLAHAAGNLLLRLHDWNVDFACWCSYKYLNSGPGGVGGLFVHDRHANDPSLPRFAGWWGVDPGTRFVMDPTFIPQRGAMGWALSNEQVLPLAAHRASLELFASAGMERLRAKSLQLTGYLEALLDSMGGDRFKVITPRDTAQRGCQLSVRIPGDARQLAGRLKERGAIVDFRTPDVIRLAPVPLYTTFEEVWKVAHLLDELA